MSPLVGIDLGTTNSLCAVFSDGKPELVPSSHGRFLTPSCVGILGDGQLIVGEAACELAVTQPERTAARFKRWMGTDRTIAMAGREFTAQDLSSLVLRSLAADAQAFLGRPVEEVVITVPAYFNEHQREATRIAGELANLRVQRIVNEPTAAALTYGLVDKDEDKQILVFDLGGGTFDVTLMEVFEGTLEIVATAGESHLGGEDFTDRLVDKCLREVGAILEVAELKEPLRVSRLRQQAELAKRRLATEETATIRIPNAAGVVDPDGPSVPVSEGDFLALAESLMQRIERPVARVLRDGRCGVADVSEVILVGGATRMRMIREFVTDYFGREPRCSLDPDEVVAKGAAVQAALIADDGAVEDMVMTDVCPFTLGVEITKEFGSHHRDGYFCPVIHRNTTIPVSREEIVYTLMANQRDMQIRVFQGEGRKVADNLLLGEIHVTGIPPREKGAPVAVRFTYDLNGLLEVEAMIEETGKKFCSLFTHNVRNLAKAEIQKAARSLQSLKFYPREDATNRKLLLFGERVIGEISRHERADLEEVLDEYERALRGGDRESFDFTRQQLLIVLSRLGHPFDDDAAQQEPDAPIS